MNPSRLLQFQIVAALGLLVLGYLIGRRSAQTTSVPPESASSGPSLSREPSAAATLVSGSNPGSDSSTETNREWCGRWARLSAQPHSPANDEAAESALQTLAETDPSRALAIALKETSRQRRTGWLHAVLRGWAFLAPEAAATWITQLPPSEREGAESAVMEGASLHPEAAVALAQRLVQDDPARARSHAGQLLRVLSHRGDYEESVEFASHLPEQIRSEMLGTAFQYWAQAQPERALEVAVKLPASGTRTTALDAALSSWAQSDPAGLAEVALKFSSIEDRSEALQTALREWVLINPKAASDWMDRFDAKPELDAGAAAVALQPDVLAKQPEIAASWAESITRPELRSATLAQVLREWSARDSSAALNYAKVSTALQPADRAALIEEFGPHPLGP